MIPLRSVWMFGLVALTAAGCAGRQTRTTVVPPPQPQPVFPSGPATGLPAGAIPAPAGAGLPAGAMVAPPGGPSGPAAPPASQPFPTAPAPQSGFPVAPQSAPPASSNAAPGSGLDRVGYRWEPVGPPASTPAPQPAPRAPSVLLLPPQPERSEPGGGAQPNQPQFNETRQRYPVGIAGFDRTRETVHTGRRPSLEGLDWLKQDGYRTIVCLHRAGENIDSDREQVEKRGLTFRPFVIDPKQLARETVNAFLDMPRDASAGKTFVYDLDGTLAGPLWYLAFRLVDQNTHEVAVVRVNPLSLREEQDPAAREMWQAVRKQLAERGVN